MKRQVILTEWLWTIQGPKKYERGRISVNVRGVDRRDRPVASATARLVELYLNAARRPL